MRNQLALNRICFFIILLFLLPVPCFGDFQFTFEHSKKIKNIFDNLSKDGNFQGTVLVTSSKETLVEMFYGASESCSGSSFFYSV